MEGSDGETFTINRVVSGIRERTKEQPKVRRKRENLVLPEGEWTLAFAHLR